MNLSHYGASVREVIALEPARRLIAMAQRRARAGTVPVSFVAASAEEIPLHTASVDSVVTSWSLCTIRQVDQALVEMRRVLRPGGRLFFVEHGLAPDERVRRWQDRLTPVWSRVSGGCHLNRPIAKLIEDAGFHVDRLQAGYMPGPKLMTYMYEGNAVPR